MIIPQQPFQSSPTAMWAEAVAGGHGMLELAQCCRGTWPDPDVWAAGRNHRVLVPAAFCRLNHRNSVNTTTMTFSEGGPKDK